MIRNVDNDRLATLRRTSICKSSVLNIGRTNPRVLGRLPGDGVTELSARMPRRRVERNYLPSHLMVLSTVLKCVPLCATSSGRGRSDVEQGFLKAMKTEKESGEAAICKTPLRWIESSLGPCFIHPMARIDTPGDVFPSPGNRDCLTEFMLMDVILNRRLLSQNNKRDGGSALEVEQNPVVMATAYDIEDLHDDSDYKYRTMIAFLPGAGVFYCARERRRGDVGCEKALIQLDMSWLCLPCDMSSATPTKGRLSFGKDGYVKCLAVPMLQGVSAWRVSTSNLKISRRLVHWANQCADADGPCLPPDYFGGGNFGAWPLADLGQEYNRQLARSKSSRIGGRHYAMGCLHRNIPDNCLVVDGVDSPHVDIIVDVAPFGTCKHRKSVIMIRNLDQETRLIRDLRTISLHNSLLRRVAPVGAARSCRGDVGTMHPIGTRVLLDGVTMSEYGANSKVPPRLFRSFVHSLARIGALAFPDVLAVIQDAEADAGAKPCPAMTGDANGYRVGYSIDMSVDLANASHFDVHDASQGFSVWTEDRPGVACNWYFIMPNLHGFFADGRAFHGVAVKLRHGTAISWDGRVIRHCTSLSLPDGPEKKIIGQEGTFNHLYGTFTAAKERIVGAGRSRANLAKQAGYQPPVPDVCVEGDGVEDAMAVGMQQCNPTIEDADPDGHPPPKDGKPIEWIRFYRWLREWRHEDQVRVAHVDKIANADDDCSLLSSESDEVGIQDVVSATLPDGTYRIPRKKQRHN